MNQEITRRICQYVELETNYAIILNGDYGIGKTHFLKNELFHHISKLKVGDAQNDYYVPVLVSLFGAKTIEDIQTQIFLELYPILKKTGVKIFAGLANAALKYFNNSLEDLMNETGTSSQQMTHYSKILICIDDIDRKSKELELEEVFGFVNNLVENLNAKILLIANENELRSEINVENDKDVYSTLKEKVIGVSITFETNVSDTFDEIINSRYGSVDVDYFQFLKIHKEYIVSIVTLNNDNLRNLLFFLEHFRIIHKEIAPILISEKRFKLMQKSILKSLLEFSLPVSIEYKMGRLNTINFEEIKKLYKGTTINLSRFMKKDGEERPKQFVEIYEEKYFPDFYKNRIYFNSIFEYLTGTRSFRGNDLIQEIDTHYNYQNDAIPESEVVLKKLEYWDCVDLSPSEYRTLTNEMLFFVDKGLYSLDKYVTVFSYAIRFDNILNFPIEKLTKRFKRGILKGRETYSSLDGSWIRMNIDKSADSYESLKEIIDFCENLNSELKVTNEKDGITELFGLLNSDFEAFRQMMINDRLTHRYKPVLYEYEFKKIWNSLNKLKNSEIVEFGFFCRLRYRKNIFEDLYPEKEFLTQLNESIENMLKRKDKTKLRKAAFAFLQTHVLNSLANFPNK